MDRRREQCVVPAEGDARMSELDAKDREELKDSQYAFPKERKEPLNDADHVRNAMARFDQVEGVSDHERDEAWKRIKKAADKFGVEVHEKSWRELGKKKD
jgi:hypothetical protein